MDSRSSEGVEHLSLVSDNGMGTVGGEGLVLMQIPLRIKHASQGVTHIILCQIFLDHKTTKKISRTTQTAMSWMQFTVKLYYSIKRHSLALMFPVESVKLILNVSVL